MSDSEIDAITLYRQESGDHRILDGEEEITLLKRAANGDAQAVTTLVELNQRLVQRYAVFYMHSGMAACHVEFMDLVMWGNEGLLKAIRMFDVSRGLRLSTYATWWIKAVIRRYLLRHGGQYSQGIHAAEKHAKIKKARSDLYQSLCREPTTEEVADATHEKLEAVIYVLEMVPVLSLDEPSFEEREGTDYALSTESEAIGMCESAEINQALDTLTERERFIVCNRFGLRDGACMTFLELSKLLGVSGESVRQAEVRALSKLKKQLPQGLYM